MKLRKQKTGRMPSLGAAITGEAAGDNRDMKAAHQPTFRSTAKKATNKKLLLIGIGILFVVAGVGYAVWDTQYRSNDKSTKFDREFSQINKYVEEKNTPEALKHAKRALALDPNNVDAILAVANLSLEDNPAEAKQYFAQALEIYKKENDPDADGKPAINYWAAAGLAEQAGRTDEAKRFYQKMIDTADPEDSYHQDLVKQSKEALSRLK